MKKDRTGLLGMLKRCSILMFFLIAINNTNFICAQNPLKDSTVDYSFGALRLSNLIILKRSFDKGDTTNFSKLLSVKGFVKKDSSFLCFRNDSLHQWLEFYDSIPDTPAFEKATYSKTNSALVLKSANTSWKNDLKEFIRQQKWNEDIVIKENNNNEIEVNFSNLYKELQFFITLYNGDYCLILL